ncbi:o-methyltransferase [Hirsutella rhossiliensis]|uniref:O-methyltransferase domain-containing protein n=1 Tax=Hirsutella rhossiliensis TaxID=111463 RepID=A0A9P8SKB9_9HYPO|nr:o-methyltransferase domain-containing protein [Hirsutella rhossiliensis]KAH0965089.1 o-methyltransferase domain-containing protein [Hirsutella rhossiliensis]
MASSNGTASRIVELAATISTSVAKLQQMLSDRGLASPSFDEEATNNRLPNEAHDVQDAVLDATAELHDLLLEPWALLFKHAAHNNMVSFQAISRLGIAAMVPARGRASFDHIADETGLDVRTLRRLLRHAMTMRVFREPEPDVVAHTSSSRLLMMPHFNDWIGCGSDEIWPASVKMVDALQRWPGSGEPNQTGFALANNTTDSIYSVIDADPARGARFASAMKAIADSPGYEIDYIIDNYDWASLGPATVVDIGGSQGHVALELARRFRSLDVVVQDLGKVVAGADARVPEELKGRVRFVAHDFFEPQGVEADVYLFRLVLHNWADEYCIRLLRAQIPALRLGARIVIHETLMPEPGAVAVWKERNLRAVDLSMGALFNSRERSVGEWTALLTQADPRFRLRHVAEPPGSALGIIDVCWDGTE